MNKLELGAEFKKITGVTPRLDGMMSAISGGHVFDILLLDQALSHKDPEYNHIEGTYKAEACSMSDYIKLKFGDHAHDIAEQMLK